MSNTPGTRVDCTECHFSRVIGPDDDELPAQVAVEHGRETGHKLTYDEVEEELDRVSQ